MNHSDALKNGSSVFIEDVPHLLRVIDALFLSIICACAIIGNTSLWIIVCRSSSLRTITNAFILSLSCADLTVSIINMPLTVYAIIRGTWDFSEATCTISGYTNMLTLITSIMSLCNISINRYTMVCRPTFYKSVYTKRNAAIMITVVISVSALLSTPPLYGWAEYSYIPMQSFCFCDFTKDKSYAFIIIGICFGVPFTVMTFCNIMIFRSVRDSQMKVVPQLPVSTTTPAQVLNQAHYSLDSKLEEGFDRNPVNMDTNQCYSVSVISHVDQIKYVKSKNDRKFSKESNLNSGNIQKDCSETVLHGESNKNTRNVTRQNAKTFLVKIRKRRNEAQEIRLTVTLIVVLVTFFICWFPYCISMMLSIFYVESVPRSFHLFTLMIAYFNSCCNPVIYGVMNKRFRAGFKQLYCNCKKKKTANPVQ